jgi:hypothetical protein
VNSTGSLCALASSSCHVLAYRARQALFGSDALEFVKLSNIAPSILRFLSPDPSMIGCAFT